MRLTREDWLEGGFEELKEQGAQALTIVIRAMALGETDQMPVASLAPSGMIWARRPFAA